VVKTTKEFMCHVSVIKAEWLAILVYAFVTFGYLQVLNLFVGPIFKRIDRHLKINHFFLIHFCSSSPPYQVNTKGDLLVLTVTIS
jgi:hypothetical protein